MYPGLRSSILYKTTFFCKLCLALRDSIFKLYLTSLRTEVTQHLGGCKHHLSGATHKVQVDESLGVERAAPYQFIKINWDYRGTWFIVIRAGKVGPRIVKHSILRKEYSSLTWTP